MNITITDDFDLGKIAESGQCFRVRKIDDFCYRFITQDQILYIRDMGNHQYSALTDEDTWQRVWVPYFDLDRNYRAIREIPVNDPFLEEAMRFSEGIRILKQDPWEMTLSFIISQRKSIAAIRNSIETLCEQYGTALTAELSSFPDARQMVKANEKSLRVASVGYRDVFLLSAIRAQLSGKLDFPVLQTLSTSDLLAALCQVDGIGNKVASCIALFGLGRLDTAPMDVWMKRVLEKYYNGETPAWRSSPYAGLYQQYIFYWALMHKVEVTNVKTSVAT